MKKINIIYTSEALKGLKKLLNKSVHCCVTSPPYWGLRDYGVAGQLGLEATPEEFVDKIVQIFTEVKRVLRDDGTLWLNLGDSYGGSGKGAATHPESNEFYKQRTNTGTHNITIHNYKSDKIKPKDLIGVPWMVAFALRNAGWYLRQDIIWSKPNPMPESIKDRCIKAHEYIFLLSKSKKYYFDAEAIKTDTKNPIDDQKRIVERQKDSNKNTPDEIRNGIRVRKPAGWQSGSGSHGSFHDDGRAKELEYADGLYIKANKRSVWTVNTKGYKEAHFATYPEKLIVDCIKAGSSEYGCCSNCKTPYIRIIDKKLVPTKKASYNSKVDERDFAADKLDQGSNRMKDGHKPGWAYESKTLKWLPNCNCNASIEPCVVLDPFMGSGTTAVVARKLNRNYIGFEINPEYIEIAENRLSKELGMFK